LFKELKKKHRLGESKYKVNLDYDVLSRQQIDRYLYTFNQVIDEAEEYGLISVSEDGNKLTLTPSGQTLLLIFKPNDLTPFHEYIFSLIENKSGNFRHLVEFLYKSNKKTPGLMIFPNYSPRQLGFERSSIVTANDIVRYSQALCDRLHSDILEFLGIDIDLSDHNNMLLVKLQESNLVPLNRSAYFDPMKYNVITKRFRDYWISYLLNDIYNSTYSQTSFETLIYRAKQIGIVYATDFYPNPNYKGRIVYLTSVILRQSKSKDFYPLFQYQDNKLLYIHRPHWDNNQDEFVNCLVDAYFSIKRSHRSYFVNLLSIREIICYKMKIPEYIFELFLEKSYRLNLIGELRIKISLEVDKLPEETTAMYLKQEPVIIDGCR